MQLSELKRLLNQANLLIENGYEYILSKANHSKEEVTVIGSDGSEWQISYHHILDNLEEYEFKAVTELTKRLKPESPDCKHVKYELVLENGESLDEYNIDMSEADVNINGSFVITKDHKFKIMLIKGGTLVVREIS